MTYLTIEVFGIGLDGSPAHNIYYSLLKNKHYILDNIYHNIPIPKIDPLDKNSVIDVYSDFKSIEDIIIHTCIDYEQYHINGSMG